MPNMPPRNMPVPSFDELDDQSEDSDDEDLPNLE